MTNRIAQMSKIGVAAALTFSVVGTANAQARSDRVIRVTKDAAGEVVRVDTVMVYRTDTVNVYRTDTMRVNVNVPVPGPVVTNTVTVTHYDTVTMEVTPKWMHRPGGVYFGLGAGSSFMTGAIQEAQDAGVAGQMQLGWDAKHSPIGFRLDLNAVRPDQAGPYDPGTAHGSLLNFAGDLKLRTGNLSQSFPLSLYALGGGNYIRYKDILLQLNQTTAGTIGDNVAPSDGQWHDKWGWNAGGGLAYGWGSHQMFVESRVISFKGGNTEKANQIPIVIGFNWY